MTDICGDAGGRPRGGGKNERGHRGKRDGEQKGTKEETELARKCLLRRSRDFGWEEGKTGGGTVGINNGKAKRWRVLYRQKKSKVGRKPENFEGTGEKKNVGDCRGAHGSVSRASRILFPEWAGGGGRRRVKQDGSKEDFGKTTSCPLMTEGDKPRDGKERLWFVAGKKGEREAGWAVFLTQEGGTREVGRESRPPWGNVEKGKGERKVGGG